MPAYQCQCGAKYRFPDSAVGKKGRCKRCGSLFTLEAEEIALAPLADDHTTRLASAAVREAALAGSAVGLSRPLPAAAAAESPTLVVARGNSSGYWDNILWTILFAASPADLLTFLGIWIAYSVLSMIPFVSFLALWWYCTFRFQIVEKAAAGDEGFPQFELGVDIIADYLDPFFRWSASWLLVLAPALIYIFEALADGSTGVRDALFSLGDGIPGMLKAFGTDPVLVILIGAGLFLWPMVILCLALSGFGAAIRVDMMLTTIARSFPAYLVTIGLVVAATAAEHYLTVAVAGRLAPAAGGGIGALLTSGLAISFIASGLTIYADFVALRSIGLYYRHFKDKFAWNWG